MGSRDTTPFILFSALYHQIYCGWTGIQGRGSTYTSTSSAYSLNIRRMGLIICKIELYVLYHIIGKMLVYVSLVVIHTLYMSFKKFVHKFTRIKHDGIFPCTHFIHTYAYIRLIRRVNLYVHNTCRKLFDKRLSCI